MMPKSLQVYSVHRKPSVSSLEEVRFIREGFNIWAFLLTFFWAFYERLWLFGVALLFFSCGIQWIKETGMLNPVSVMVLQLGMQVLVGFYANEALRRKLKKQGYITVDIVTGDSRIRAEQRFFERALGAAA